MLHNNSTNIRLASCIALYAAYILHTYQANQHVYWQKQHVYQVCIY